jgi:hypothetical protein
MKTKVTVAEFKRVMIIGSKWNTFHQYIDNAGLPTSPLKDLGTRECGLANTVDFGFIMPDKENSISHCQWPKASELTKENDNTYYITKLGFVQLTYTKH